jgi:hypothetical protein
MSFAYSVAIKLSVANLASQGVKLLATDLLAAHGVATKLEDKLKALKTVAMGYGLSKAGGGILHFLEKSVDASKEYTRQLSLMNAAGMTHKDITEATASAWKTSRTVLTSGVAENMASLRELRSVFGKDHMHEAYGILPTVQRTKAILEALTGKEQHGVAFDMVKAAELRTSGVMTEDRLQRNADLMARTLMAMGGTLDVRDFHSTFKMGKMATLKWSDDFAYKILPTFMQEMKTSGGGSGGGAQSAGTALATLSQAVVQGVILKSSIPLWQSMGLIKPSDIVRTGTGATQIKAGGIKGSQLFQENPYEWANTVLAPAIAGYGKTHGLNREQVIAKMFGNRNAQFAANTFIGKSAQFERDKTLIESVGDSKEAYDKLLKTNPQLASMAMHKQWENIQARIGYEILPRMIPYMLKFADQLDRLSQWMEKNPGEVEATVKGLIGLGLGLKVVGTAMMGVGMVRFLGLGSMVTGLGTAAGGLATGLAAAAVAAVGLIAGTVYLTKHWSELTPKFESFWDSFWHTFALSLDDTIFGKIMGSDHRYHGAKGGKTFTHADDAALSLTGRELTTPFVYDGGRAGGGSLTVNLHADGRKLTEVIIPHLADKLSRRANASGSSFDSTMSLAPVGLNYAK